MPLTALLLDELVEAADDSELDEATLLTIELDELLELTATEDTDDELDDLLLELTADEARLLAVLLAVLLPPTMP